MRIVQVVPWSFLVPDDGGRVRTAALATALSRRGELHVLDLSHNAPPGGFRDGDPVRLPYGGAARYWSCIPGGTAWHRFLRRHREAREFLGCAAARRLAPHVAVADDLRCAGPAFRCGAPRVVLSTHNVESGLHGELESRDPGGGKGHRARSGEFARAEARFAPRADEVWTVRPSDGEWFLRLGARRARTVPNVVPDGAFDAPSAGIPGTGVFFGSLWWAPNADAAASLAATARRLAGVRPAGSPPLRIVVAGRGAPEALLRLLGEAAPFVSAPGFVEDLKALVRPAGAVLLPIGWGGGTKVKTIEALALGKPVVTTPEGAAGLDLEDGVHARVAPLGEPFDRAAAEVLDRPDRFLEMAVRGQRHARERFSQGALDRIVGEALDGVAGESAEGGPGPAGRKERER